MKAIVLLLFMLTQSNLLNAENIPVKINTAIVKVYIPEGFDDNDHVQIVGEGIFPNSCFRAAESDALVNLEKREIIINPKAFKYEGLCLQVLIPFEMSFHFGFLQSGSYSIRQHAEGPLLGTVNVHGSKTSEPDDYLYAPISQAFLKATAGSATVFLTGDFPVSCMKMKEVKFQVQADVIVVQPVAEIDSSVPCKQGSFPFSTSKNLGMVNSGKYLLHIRSMNGKAVNNLIKVP